jgi:hypothetical protein
VLVFNNNGNIRECKIARDHGKFIMKVTDEVTAFSTMEPLISACAETMGVQNVATKIIATLTIHYDD